MSSTQNYEISFYIENIEPHKRQHGLPSWVPDWTRANPGSLVTIMHHAGKEYPTQPPHPRLILDGGWTSKIAPQRSLAQACYGT
jgi:hypothetical protein